LAQQQKRKKRTNNITYLKADQEERKQNPKTV